MSINVGEKYHYIGDPMTEYPWVVTIIKTNPNIRFYWDNSSGHHVGEFSTTQFNQIFKLKEAYIIDQVLNKYLQ
jgi:hypothetical protein